MTTPTTVWVNLQRDQTGRPRGFEKSSGRYYMTEIDAAHDAQQHKWPAVECVLMSRAEYDRLVEPRDGV